MVLKRDRFFFPDGLLHTQQEAVVCARVATSWHSSVGIRGLRCCTRAMVRAFRGTTTVPRMRDDERLSRAFFFYAPHVSTTTRIMRWDEMLSCVCSSVTARPSVQELLDVLRAEGVCLGTQCFHTLDDAVPMHAPTPAWDDYTWPSVLTLLVVAALLRRRANRPLFDIKGPGRGPQPPPPPPPPPPTSHRTRW